MITIKNLPLKQQQLVSSIEEQLYIKFEGISAKDALFFISANIKEYKSSLAADEVSRVCSKMYAY